MPGSVNFPLSVIKIQNGTVIDRAEGSVRMFAISIEIRHQADFKVEL